MYWQLTLRMTDVRFHCLFSRILPVKGFVLMLVDGAFGD
jgi:hypothetical protein